jgi:hypothetical protein
MLASAIGIRVSYLYKLGFGSRRVNNLAGRFQRKRVRLSEIALGKEKLSPQIGFIENDEEQVLLLVKRIQV